MAHASSPAVPGGAKSTTTGAPLRHDAAGGRRPGVATMNDPIVLEGVSKRYRRGDELVAALVDVSFSVAAGEVVALVGPSGCGKSTTLNLVAGVDHADAGRVVVGGLDLSTAAEAELVTLRRRTVGIVFQAFHLVPHLSVEENVALPLALDGRRDPARVAGLLERVGLLHRRRHFPGELSGGEQQRTAVARALVHRPRVLLADEPTGNLDSASGAGVLRVLDELRRAEHAALLLVTHDDNVATLADRVVRLRDGRVEAIL
jgi:ABC-type lipoprotein export system ATPase subunit